LRRNSQRRHRIGNLRQYHPHALSRDETLNEYRVRNSQLPEHTTVGFPLGGVHGPRFAISDLIHIKISVRTWLFDSQDETRYDPVQLQREAPCRHFNGVKAAKGKRPSRSLFSTVAQELTFAVDESSDRVMRRTFQWFADSQRLNNWIPFPCSPT
jgi:hypothetical protein